MSTLFAIASASLDLLLHLVVLFGTNRILHRIPMQTEKPQPKNKWVMPETRLTEFLVLFVDPRVGISQCALITDV